MRRVIKAVLLTAILIFSFVGVATSAQEVLPDDVTSIISDMQERYEALSGFSANLSQKLTNAANGSTESRTGTLSFRQPALIRWQTDTPEPELLVVGKDAVWDYFPEAEAAYRYTTEQVLGSKTMLRFLSGKARLDEDFFVSPLGKEDGFIKLELVPRNPEPNLVQAYLWLAPKSHFLQRVVIVDFFGNENDVTLQSLVLNPSFPDGHFDFSPPEGTEIIENQNE